MHPRPQHHDIVENSSIWLHSILLMTISTVFLRRASVAVGRQSLEPIKALSDRFVESAPLHKKDNSLIHSNKEIYRTGGSKLPINITIPPEVL